MMFNEKAFLIMGATSGIGAELCRSLAEQGAHLFMTGREIHKVEELKESLPNKERHLVQAVSINEASYESLRISLQDFIKKFSLDGISGAVYLPGIFPLIPLRMITEQNIDEIFRINYTGAMMMFKTLVHKNIRSNHGMSLVGITSVSSHKGQKGYSLYGASKAALASSVRSLALEMAPISVRINCVCCAHMDTSTNIERASVMKDREENLKSLHPLGIGSPVDAVNAINYLLSEKSRWVTGTELVVDGGFLA